MVDAIIRFDGISKRFAGVNALEEVSFSIGEGEIHGLVGENGAGKSTLVKICSGVHQPDKGKLYFRGEHTRIPSTRFAEEDLGISVVHQEIPLCTNLTVAQNVFLGPNIEEKNFKFFPDWDEINRKTRELFHYLNIGGIKPDRNLEHYSVAERQLVAIAQAINRDAEILILDEPTSALPNQEAENLLEILKNLKREGYTIIYISHKLEEVFDVTEMVTVLRNGRHIGTRETEKVDMDDVVSMMVGEKNTLEVTGTATGVTGDRVLEVENLSQEEGMLGDISFDLHKGEVLGFAGIKGAGRTELAHCIFGYRDYDSGTIRLDDRKVEINSPKTALGHGIGYLPEDRTTLGLFFEMTVQENIATTTINSLTSGGLIDRGKLKQQGEKYVEELDIATPGIQSLVSKLSGGNQQKVLLARWLAAQPRILILDEPTRGIDVGTKAEIRNLITELKREGVSVILISSELDEVLELSDRIVVMREGSINGRFDRSEVTKDRVVAKATGASQ